MAIKVKHFCGRSCENPCFAGVVNTPFRSIFSRGSPAVGRQGRGVGNPRPSVVGSGLRRGPSVLGSARSFSKRRDAETLRSQRFQGRMTSKFDDRACSRGREDRIGGRVFLCELCASASLRLKTNQPSTQSGQKAGALQNSQCDSENARFLPETFHNFPPGGARCAKSDRARPKTLQKCPKSPESLHRRPTDNPRLRRAPLSRSLRRERVQSRWLH